MSIKTACWVATICASALTGCITAATPVDAQPSGGSFREEPPPPCPGPPGTGPHVYLPIAGDPASFEECLGGTPQGVQQCPSGQNFSAAVPPCAPQGATGLLAPTITVDGVSQAGDAINVKVTYSGTNLGYIGVDVSDPAAGLKGASGRTDFAGAGPGGVPLSIPLSSDGQMHSITVPARPLFGPPWILAPGQQVSVAAHLFFIDQSGGLGAPILAADATQMFTAPGQSAQEQSSSWSGSWSAGGQSIPATLTLDSTDPLAGTIDISGVCSAKWTEIQRTSDISRVVSAHVISGADCRDNQWNVTIQQNRITGTDSSHPDSSFSLLRD